MNTNKVLHVFNKLFLIQLVEIVQFTMNKDLLEMDVLCVEEKGTIDKKYHLHFSGVIAFDYWKDNWILSDNNLEVDVDDGLILPLSEAKKYTHLNLESKEEYWCLSFANEGFSLSVVFRDIIKKSII